MSIRENYRYLSAFNATWFIFESVGPAGKIVKMVAYEPKDNIRWNLGFGDLKDGEIDDSVISNNGDIVKVMNTVAITAIEFLQQYPERIIFIEPVDKKRAKLYNTIFKRNWRELEKDFEITGWTGSSIEPYDGSKEYEAFEISLKSLNLKDEK